MGHIKQWPRKWLNKTHQNRSMEYMESISPHPSGNFLAQLFLVAPTSRSQLWSTRCPWRKAQGARRVITKLWDFGSEEKNHEMAEISRNYDSKHGYEIGNMNMGVIYTWYKFGNRKTLGVWDETYFKKPGTKITDLDSFYNRGTVQGHQTWGSQPSNMWFLTYQPRNLCSFTGMHMDHWHLMVAQAP